MRLMRVSFSIEATLGVLLDDLALPVALTLEEPWKENARGISCIPPGRYTLSRVMSPKRQAEVFQFDRVPGRNAIQIHVGNTVDDIEGCILLGTTFGELNARPAVLHSKLAFDAFMARMKTTTSFTLDVWNPASTLIGDRP